jgi:hypothetical protein
MMNEMLALIPTGSNKDDYIFLGIFLRKLLSSMREHLAAANHTTAAAMSTHADILWDAKAGDTSISAISDASISAVANRSFARRSPDRRRGRSGQRRKPTPGPDSRRRDASTLCFYHSRFGQRANKCEPPCSWTEN